MSFLDAMRKAFAGGTTFDGRSSRPEFWWWALFIWVLDLLVFGVGGRGSGFVAFIAYVGMLVLWLATIAVGCRRLHDTGRTGWLQLLALIPCIGLLVLIYFWAQPTQAGDNAYGPPPAG